MAERIVPSAGWREMMTTMGASRSLRRLLFLVLAIGFLALGAAGRAAPAGTVVATDIVADTTWTVGGSPYRVTEPVRVVAGVTLTIEPGVIVQGEYATDGLVVEGVLVAAGTAEAPIRFTGVMEAPGSWRGVHVHGPSAPAAARLDHILMEYAGGYVGNASLYVENASVTVTNSAINHSEREGIEVYSPGHVDIADSSFTGNSEYAVYYHNAAANPSLANLTAEGNGADVVAIDMGTMTGVHLWEATGLPYRLAGPVTVAKDSSLTIEPGVVVEGEGGTDGIVVQGSLAAVGTAEAPTRFTGVTKTPGSWRGLQANGTAAAPARVLLENAILEYGGGYVGNAQLHAQDAQLTVSNTVIRYSSSDGVRVYNSSQGSLIEASAIVANEGYGLRNPTPDWPFLAPHNWWGAATGPALESADCHPGGGGSLVSEGVLFHPYLTRDGEPAPEVAPLPVYRIMLSPERWFVPADGVTRAVVLVSVRDGAGNPAPGVDIAMRSTRGTIAPRTGTTNISGEFYATVVASTAGEAIVAATGSAASCENFLPATTQITFTEFGGGADLAPDAAAPYANGRIDTEPKPVVRGVETTTRVRVSNPNDFPIRLNGSFFFFQYGIGQTSGPLKQVEGIEIAAQSEETIEVSWVPAVTGHYCIRFEYAWESATRAPTDPWVPRETTGSAQDNNDTRTGNYLDGEKRPDLSQYAEKKPGSTKNSLQQAQQATNRIGDGQFALNLITDRAAILGGFIQDQFLGNILGFIFEGGGGINCGIAGGESCGGWNGPRVSVPIVGSLSDDPPSQQYRQLYVAETLDLPVVEASAEMPAARAAAINELIAASGEATVNVVATAIAHDRYAGAAQAGDLKWSSLQANAYLHYLKRAGGAFMRVADAFDALAAELADEGIADVFVRAEDYAAYQQRLQTTGFTPLEIEAAHRAGLPDDTIEKIRLRRIALDPAAVAGSQLEAWAEVATAYRDLGQRLLATPGFGSGTGTAAPEGAVEALNLVRLYGTATEFVVGNPYETEKTVELRIRSLSLPWDWTVVVSPETVTLGPGEETTATVYLSPGLAAPQGIQPRVAVEGYVDGELLGGVVVNVLVPEERSLDSAYELFLPALQQR